MKCDIADHALAEKGRLRIEWAGRSMPVLNQIRKRFEEEKPLEGVTLGACLHVTTETANLCDDPQGWRGRGGYLRLQPPVHPGRRGRQLWWPTRGISVYAIKGEDTETYYQHLNAVLDAAPNITMDDGADLVSQIHSERKDLISGIIGGTEETTTGVIRLRAMAADGVLAYPIVAVNDAMTKHLFDNRYGTGQSTIDGIIRATNRLVAGSYFVVCGYGWCGRGVAMRADGLGAKVIVTEVDPLRALEAVMDGYQVMPIAQAAPIGDFFCTVTGDINVIRKEHFQAMKDGAIVANSGHFNVELDLEGLAEITKSNPRDPRLRGGAHPGQTANGSTSWARAA